jgi:protein O-GlcNAc transferase
MGAIAQQVPGAQFVFLGAHQSQLITEQFTQRLDKAFEQFNLNSQDYCVILPRLSQEDYWSLNLASDIFLDTIDWSGGNTTLEAIALDLPVVTIPGEFRRSRHSFAILTIKTIFIFY